MEKQNYYKWLCGNDVFEWCKPLLEQAGWIWRESDGKIHAQLKPGVAETPWHHVKSDYRLKCGLWHQIMFDLVGSKLPDGKQFVPSKCQQCFKVVVRPRSLRQLFALVDIQKSMGMPSKCGIERRQSVHGLYGGYFYNVGLPEGLERYNQVREAVDMHELMGTDVEVFLKRGCTEFEHACGDSDKWEITDYQIHVERLLERHLITDDVEITQPEKLIHHVHRRWIEYAYANGDKTYAEFTGGEPLYTPYKTYHHFLIDKDGNVSEKPKKKERETAVSKKAKKREKAVK